MNIEYKDFVGYYKNVYPEGYCSHLISEFDRLESGGAGSNRQSNDGAFKHYKDDHQIFINIRNHPVQNFNNEDTCDLFFQGLQECYEEYSEKYSTLKTSGRIRSSYMKMQRTGPGGGYHVWHHEQAAGSSQARVLTYILYLNTLLPEQAGETEFLYQQARVGAEENMMLLWPAAFTHCHRGNAVYGTGHKYIVTGWFYYE
jgi:hypothetical protein